jgi:hypothetical protein
MKKKEEAENEVIFVLKKRIRELEMQNAIKQKILKEQRNIMARLDIKE